MDQEEQNEPMEVNADTDGSSSDGEEEQMLISKAEELERQIADNKYLYNAHDELVKLYRQLGDLTSMRLAYERFHEYFPLTPDIWLAWINVEKQVAVSESEVKAVLALFDKAVEDYLAVDVWIEYAQYSIGAQDLEATRQLIERGLTAAGLHTADGSLLWDTLREIELAHLTLAEPNTDQWKEQLLKVVEVYRRQLSVPLLDMEKTYNEWKEWLAQLPPDHKINTEPVEWGYKKALKTLETYKPFEEKIQATTDEADLLQIYKDYIKILSDPSTIMCVFERATAQMCLNINIWLEYCNYALKLGEPADKVSSRALRNCPWSEELWVTRLRVLEQLGKEEKDIMTCFEQGISNLSGNPGIELWLSYIEYVSRNTDNKEKLYKTFDQALKQLSYNQEGLLKLTKWYSRILAKTGAMPKARQLWKTVLKIPENKSNANIWLEFANLERQYGEPNQVRSLFQRALTSCGEWSQYVAEEWLVFERENGKLSDVMKCIEKRKELVKVEQPQPSPTKEEDVHKGVKRKPHFAAEPEGKKPKFGHKEPLRKKVDRDPAKTVFVSNLHTTVNEKRLKKMFPKSVNIEIVTDRQGNSRCYGYVQFNIEEEVTHALARDRELLDGRPIFISNCKPNRSDRKSGFKYSLESESKKLFIKGLPLVTNEDALREIFKAFNCKDVRIVRRRDGQSKGLAYVEFDDEETAQRAMSKTDQLKIGEHTITVAISAPPPKAANLPKASAPVRHSRSKLELVPRALQVKGPSNESNGEAKPVKGKSNEDFRKMLLK